MVDFSQLNANQLEAVHWDEGRLLILAGPGLGKTRVLIYRIARIIEATAGEYFRVLGLTYTHAAAAEMLKRIDLLVPNARERILLTPFHAFCAAILRQHGHHIGLRPDFAILTQPEERQDLLEEAMAAARECSLDMEYNSERLLSIVTHLLDRNVEEDKALEFLVQRYGVRAPGVVSSVYAFVSPFDAGKERTGFRRPHKRGFAAVSIAAGRSATDAQHLPPCVRRRFSGR